MTDSLLYSKVYFVELTLITDTTKPVTIPEDEYIKPYKFENNEAFYKVLFPYADK